MASRLLLLVLVLIVQTLAPAAALVGTDLSKEAPDVFCAAYVASVIPIHQLDRGPGERDLGTDNEFAVVLAADTPKTVSGVLQVLSKDQPFKVPFTDHNLTAASYTDVQGARVVGSGTTYRSTPIYFSLPKSMPLDAIWIFDVSVNGKPAACATLAVTYDPPTPGFSERHVDGPTADETRRSAPASPNAALPEDKLDLSACPVMTSDAKMVEPVTPSYPQGLQPYSGTVIIKIAIDAAGRVADATVLLSSGLLQLDRAAFYAAVHSRYRPSMFLCAPVPGFYSFKSEFEP